MNTPRFFAGTRLLWILTALFGILAMSGCSQEQAAAPSSAEEVASFKGDPSKAPANAQARMQNVPAKAK